MPDRLVTMTVVEVEGGAVLEWRERGGGWGIYGDPHPDRAAADRELAEQRGRVVDDVTLGWEDGPDDELDVLMVRGAPEHAVFGACRDAVATLRTWRRDGGGGAARRP